MSGFVCGAGKGLTDAGCHLVARIAGALLPACADRGLPGADDAAIFENIANKLTSRTADFEALLEASFGGAEGVRLMAKTDDAAFAAGLDKARQASAVCFPPMLVAIVQSYYADPRVLTALGRPASPPFPRGNEVAVGDWSLLEPVRRRGPIYRVV